MGVGVLRCVGDHILQEFIFCRSSYSAGVKFCIWPDSEPTKLLDHPQNLRGEGTSDRYSKNLPQSPFTGIIFYLTTFGIAFLIFLGWRQSWWKRTMRQVEWEISTFSPFFGVMAEAKGSDILTINRFMNINPYNDRGSPWPEKRHGYTIVRGRFAWVEWRSMVQYNWYTSCSRSWLYI